MITKELKGTKAITLIAMVISILVLLILAGISLALVVGETGITQRAVTAKKTYDIAGAKEKLELQIAGYAGDFYQDKYINGSIGSSETVGSYVLGKFTNGSDFEGDYTLTKDGNKITITNKKDTSQIATATIAENGKVSWNGTVSGNGIGGGETPTLPAVTVTFYENKGDGKSIGTVVVNSGSSIESEKMPANPEKANYAFIGWKKTSDDSTFTASSVVSENTSVYAEWLDPYATFGTAKHTADYGKIVTGYTGNATIESRIWRLFYADSTRAYLISDNIGGQGLDSITGFLDASGSNISTLGKNLNPGCSSTFWITNPSYNNKKGTSVLLNKDNFVNYKNSYAYWAIGAPTLEMFKASYNSTHTSEAISAYKATEGHLSETLTETQIDCRVESDSAMGFQVKKVDGTWSYTTNGLGNTSAIDQAIYCPSSELGWWIASPAAYDDWSVMYVCNYKSGSFYHGFDYDSTNIGVRPLVSVPEAKLGNEITITSNY